MGSVLELQGASLERARCEYGFLTGTGTGGSRVILQAGQSDSLSASRGSSGEDKFNNTVPVQYCTLSCTVLYSALLQYGALHLHMERLLRKTRQYTYRQVHGHVQVRE